MLSKINSNFINTALIKTIFRSQNLFKKLTYTIKSKKQPLLKSQKKSFKIMEEPLKLKVRTIILIVFEFPLFNVKFFIWPLMPPHCINECFIGRKCSVKGVLKLGRSSCRDSRYVHDVYFDQRTHACMQLHGQKWMI